jgi:putative nucleotidyltransferase with HDIG domain
MMRHTPVSTGRLSRAETLEREGRFGDARSEYERLLRDPVCVSSGTEHGIASLILRRIARCFVEEANIEAAEDCLDVAEAVARAEGDAAGIAHATNLRAIAAQQLGDLALARQLYTQARRQAQGAGASALVAMLDQNLGTVANIRGEFSEAQRRYRQSLRAYRVLGMEYAMTQVLNNLGMLYTDLREWSAAEDSLSDAVRAAKASGDVAGRLRAEANRVELCIARGQYRKARQLARRLLAASGHIGGFGRGGQPDRTSRAGGQPDSIQAGAWLGEIHKHLGVIARELGDMPEAERCFRQALWHAERRHDLLLRAETLREQATVYQRTRRNRETLLALNEAHALFGKLTARRELSDVDGRVARLEEEFLAIVREWGSSIESADHYTQGHCERVADYACALARDVGMDDQALFWFRMGALLHDVGKIDVPAEILNKPSALSDLELAVMREHPVRGEQLIAGIAFPWDIKPMIRHHHERWDGRGYPDRLAGAQIPSAARILCIADVFDALTSTRSYRTAYSPGAAASLMWRDSGTLFDPVLLGIFLERTLKRLERRAERAA